MGRAARSRWRVVAGSVAGPGHFKEGRANDDRWLQEAVHDDVQLLAIADGAGSRQGAGEGAQLAVRAAAYAARQVFAGGAPSTPEDWQQALGEFASRTFRKFDEAVDQLAPADLFAGSAARPGERLRSKRDHFATTLTAAVLADPWYAYLTVGDGFMAVRRADGGVHLLVAPPLDRVHAGATTFLTSAGRNEAASVRHAYDPGIDGVALCTDGLAEACLEVEKSSTGLHYAAPPSFAVWFEFADSDTASGMDLQRKFDSREFAMTSEDDKTMVLAVKA